MATCKTCGATVPDGLTACPTCGSSLASQASQQLTDQTAGVSLKPEKKKGKLLKVVLLIVAVLVVILVAMRCSSGKDDAYEWPTGALAQMLPTMNHKCASVLEYEDTLRISVEDGVTKDEYNTYLEACKEKGFTVEAEEMSDSYEAYNEDGYFLHLSFFDYG